VVIAVAIIVAEEHEMAITYSERLRPDEAFKRGFYYGLGFWVAGIFLQALFFVVGIVVLLALGIISSAVLSPIETSRTVRTEPQEFTAPVTAPARRR
jgi:hypothetical protein